MAEITMAEESGTPSTPPSGYFQIYAKTDGKLYTKNDAGDEVCLTDSGSAGGGIPNDGWIDKTAETWTYASADDPTFTFTISGDLTGTYQPGQRIKLTQTTVKYFIITKVEHAGGTTTVTVYGGTDYDLANAAISNNYYSPVKGPFGFPLNPAKWSVEVTDTTQRSQSPTENVWYNLGSVSISIPIGAWEVSYQVCAQQTVAVSIFTTLSNANNSQSDINFTARSYVSNTGNTHVRSYPLVLTSKTAYYLNSMSDATTGTLYNRNELSKLIIRAVCAYL